MSITNLCILRSWKTLFTSHRESDTLPGRMQTLLLPQLCRYDISATMISEYIWVVTTGTGTGSEKQFGPPVR